MSFSANEVLPGIYHIQDPMGVCVTLLVGSQSALLIDTAYGVENLSAFVKTLTDLPVMVIVTHAHHDHALGAMHFDKTWMFPQDQADFPTYTNEMQRRRVLAGAAQRGIQIDETAFLNAPIPMPEVLIEQTIDLGGITAQVILCPGHTPGSAVVYVKERQLLLTADDWNPCTWLFFPAALGAKEYRANVTALLKLPFHYVLCSHQPVLFERAKLEEFIAHLSDENLRQARPVNISPYEAIDTYQADMGEGQIFVFDWQKAGL